MFANGFQYKLHDKMLPGKPDIRNTCIKELSLYSDAGAINLSKKSNAK
jgi:hypothetical protein